jgi:hypothetical protein
VLPDGCVAATRLTSLDDASLRLGRQNVEAFTRWLVANRPEVHKRLFLNATIRRLDAANARLLLGSLADWKQPQQ